MTPGEERVVATHEAGHAVCSLFCDHSPPIERITIESEIPGRSATFAIRIPLIATSARATVSGRHLRRPGHARGGDDVAGRSVDGRGRRSGDGHRHRPRTGGGAGIGRAGCRRRGSFPTRTNDNAGPTCPRARRTRSIAPSALSWRKVGNAPAEILRHQSCLARIPPRSSDGNENH